MKHTQSFLVKQFSDAMQSAFPELQAPRAEVQQSTQEKFGHYQCNNAMKLAKELKSNPRAIATKIVENLKPSPMIAKLDIEGPGFINITLSNTYIGDKVKEMLTKPNLGLDPPEKREKIIIDFSSPNTAKEMHVGHLRSTIIGDCLARVFEFLGHDVLRLNHIGDWGTQFGMLIAYLKIHAPDVLTGKQQTDLTHLMQWYKASKVTFDSDPSFKRTAQQEVIDLQAGNPTSRKIWELICKISAKGYQQIYDLLDIKIVERGESFYNSLLADVVADLEKKNLTTVSDGAKCIFLDGFENPMIVQKSDGGYNYDTTDMAAIRHRIVDEKADRIIYVIDHGQGTHMQMVFQAASKAGYLDPAKVRAQHAGFGLVLGADGKKFRTRSGETEKLIDLLQTAVVEARKILTERKPDLKGPELDTEAASLGLSAVKYADLSVHRMSDYAFSYEKMLKFEGNTAAFIMYSYVRVGGIKRKCNVQIEEIISTPITLTHPSEIALGVHLIQFPEMLEQVAEDLLPNRLTDYLYTLAEKFNAFFRDCRVEGTPEQNSRLLLCEACARTLKQGLALLGIKTLERM